LLILYSSVFTSKENYIVIVYWKFNDFLVLKINYFLQRKHYLNESISWCSSLSDGFFSKSIIYFVIVQFHIMQAFVLCDAVKVITIIYHNIQRTHRLLFLMMRTCKLYKLKFLQLICYTSSALADAYLLQQSVWRFRDNFIFE
jgi:hypothetical protein